jgi:hypothetical protein
MQAPFQQVAGHPPRPAVMLDLTTWYRAAEALLVTSYLHCSSQRAAAASLRLKRLSVVPYA